MERKAKGWAKRRRGGGAKEGLVEGGDAGGPRRHAVN